MAYTPGNLSLLFDTIEGSQRWWTYPTSDALSAVIGSGYFSDAFNKRMNIGDIVWVFSGTLNTSASATTESAETFPATVGVSSLFTATPSFESYIVSAVSAAGAATVIPAKASTITDNSGGVGNAATGIVATLATQTFLIPVQLSDLGTGAETLNIDPGFNGKITAANLRVIKAGAGSGATQTLTAQVNGTNVTGGVVNPTLANTATPGGQVAGSAITALNTFTSAQPIGVNVTTGGTVFTAGDAVIELTVVNTDLANAIATLIKF